MLIHTNQPLITPIFCLITDESALIRNFVRNGRVYERGGRIFILDNCWEIRKDQKSDKKIQFSGSLLFIKQNEIKVILLPL